MHKEEELNRLYVPEWTPGAIISVHVFRGFFSDVLTLFDPEIEVYHYEKDPTRLPTFLTSGDSAAL